MPVPLTARTSGSSSAKDSLAVCVGLHRIVPVPPIDGAAFPSCCGLRAVAGV